MNEPTTPKSTGCGCGPLILAAILVIVGGYWGIAYLLPWLSHHVVLFDMIAKG